MNASTPNRPLSSVRRSPFRAGVLALALLLLGAQPSFALAVKTPAASDGTYSSKVVVSWARTSGASQYKVFRSTTPYWRNRVLVRTVGSGTRSIGDTSAIPGVRYYYWVCPVQRTRRGSCYYYNTSKYNSGYRAMVVPTPSASDGSYSGYVQVSWSSVYGASSYKVFRSKTPYWSSRTLIRTTTARSICDTSAVPGVQYYYWVCPVGRSYWFYNGSKYNPGYRSMLVPTPLVYCSYDHTTVSWSAQYGAAKYRVYRSTSPYFSTCWTPYCTTTSTTIYDYNLEEDVTYYYWVCPVGEDYWFYNRYSYDYGWLYY